MTKTRGYGERPEEVKPVRGQLLEPQDPVLLEFELGEIEDGDQANPRYVQQDDGSRQNHGSATMSEPRGVSHTTESRYGTLCRNTG